MSLSSVPMTDPSERLGPLGATVPYRICTRTVMDTSDRDITFDEEGVSNHWYEYQEAAKTLPASSAEFDRVVERIKRAGVGQRYDCVLGLSGGADSSYMALLA